MIGHETNARATRQNPLLRSVLEIGPLAVFFLAFRYGDRLAEIGWVRDTLLAVTDRAALASESGPLYVATLAFMIAVTLALSASWVLNRKLPKMTVVTAVIVAIFGGLTIWLQDETFIKMKPTIINGMFGLILAVGLLRGRSYLKYLLGEALPLDDAGWMIFTRRWVMFFVFMALLNELVWRTQTTAFWVSFKTFSGIPLTLLFLASQVPLLQRHAQETDDAVAEGEARRSGSPDTNRRDEG